MSVEEAKTTELADGKLVDLVRLLEDHLPAEAAVPVFGAVTGWYFQLFVMVLIMVPQVLINIFGIRLTARLNDFSVWWHIGGVLAIVVLLNVLVSMISAPASRYSL